MTSSETELENDPVKQDFLSSGFLGHLLKESDIELIKYNCSDKILFSNDEDPLIITQDIIDSEECLLNNMTMFTKQDSVKLEKFLQSKSSLERREKLCQRHKKNCADCQLLSQRNNLKENNLIQAIWNNIEARKQADGTFLIRHNNIYRNDITKLYAPNKSNILAAKGHSKKIISKCNKKGQLGILNEQVDKAIKKTNVTRTIF